MTHSDDTRGAERRSKAKLSAILALVLAAFFAFNGASAFAASSSTATLTQNANQSASDVAAAANPATVTVINLQQQQNPFSQSSSSSDVVPAASGSGYIIDTEGHVVTNNHVIEGGQAFQVTFEDGRTVDATVVGSDPYQDVAVLQLELRDGQAVPGTLAFGDSSKVLAGDPVIAIGTPYGEYANTVTTGEVNAIDRSLQTDNASYLPNLIQHDAAIYPGNSGGPLLNMDGEVIGMNVAKAVTSNMGYQEDSNIDFAIESNAVKAIVDQIIQTGSYARPYLGIQSQLSPDGTATVEEIETNGPAADSGLQVNDVIVGMDGKALTEQTPFVNALIFAHQPGDKVTLQVQRDGSEQDVTVTLGTRPADVQ